MRSVYLFLILLAAISLVVHGRPAAVAHAAPIDPEVQRALAEAGSATFVVVLREQADLSAAPAIRDWQARGRYVVDRLTATAAGSQNKLQARRAALSGQIAAWQPLWIVNAVVVTADADAAAALARQPEVAALVAPPRIELPGTPDPTPIPTAVGSVSWGVDMIEADAVWALGVTGVGSTVGVVDTGAQWNHPALINQYRGWDGATAEHNYNWYNPDPAGTTCTDPTTPCDWMWHGTHVTGSAVGNAPGNQIGVAPGARWIHALGCCPTDAALLLALQWMLAPTDLQGQNPNPDLRPDVVNNSWGGHGGNPLFEPAMAALRASGVVPVVAAGNSGPECASLLSPADYTNTISVGNTQSNDTIRPSSSRGPGPFAGTGPDLAAPGTAVVSALPNNGYGPASGTSMAAPHVSGVVALLLEAAPALRGEVDQIAEILRRSADPKTTTESCIGVPGSARPNNTFGWGRLNALTAVNLVRDAGRLEGVVVDENGQPVPGAQVRVVGPAATLGQTATADGAYAYVIAGGLYTATAELPGYAPAFVADIGVTPDLTVTQPLTLTLLPTAVVTGTVVDALSGLPVYGARVAWADNPTRAALTDQFGRYDLELPVGPQTLRIGRAGYLDAVATVAVARNAASLAPTSDVALTPTLDYSLAVGAGPCGRAFAWRDPAGGALLALGDDASLAVTLPFPFLFYGVAYTQVHVGSNGLIMFGQGTGRLNMAVPFPARPNNAVYAFATDLNPAGGAQGTISTKTTADGAFVITYDQVQHYPSGSPETFQIVLTPDGVVQVQYLNVSDTSNLVVAVENGDGTRGTRFDNQPTAGLSLTFTPFSGSGACSTPTALTLTSAAARSSGAIAPALWTVAALLVATWIGRRRARRVNV